MARGDGGVAVATLRSSISSASSSNAAASEPISCTLASVTDSQKPSQTLTRCRPMASTAAQLVVQQSHTLLSRASIGSDPSRCPQQFSLQCWWPSTLSPHPVKGVPLLAAPLAAAAAVAALVFLPAASAILYCPTTLNRQSLQIRSCRLRQHRPKQLAPSDDTMSSQLKTLQGDAQSCLAVWYVDACNRSRTLYRYNPTAPSWSSTWTLITYSIGFAGHRSPILSGYCQVSKLRVS